MGESKKRKLSKKRNLNKNRGNLLIFLEIGAKFIKFVENWGNMQNASLT